MIRVPPKHRKILKSGTGISFYWTLTIEYSACLFLVILRTIKLLEVATKI